MVFKTSWVIRWVTSVACIMALVSGSAAEDGPETVRSFSSYGSWARNRGSRAGVSSPASSPVQSKSPGECLFDSEEPGLASPQTPQLTGDTVISVHSDEERQFDEDGVFRCLPKPSVEAQRVPPCQGSLQKVLKGSSHKQGPADLPDTRVPRAFARSPAPSVISSMTQSSTGSRRYKWNGMHSVPPVTSDAALILLRLEEAILPEAWKTPHLLPTDKLLKYQWSLSTLSDVLVTQGKTVFLHEDPETCSRSALVLPEAYPRFSHLMEKVARSPEGLRAFLTRELGWDGLPNKPAKPMRLPPRGGHSALSKSKAINPTIASRVINSVSLSIFDKSSPKATPRKSTPKSSETRPRRTVVFITDSSSEAADFTQILHAFPEVHAKIVLLNSDLEISGRIAQVKGVTERIPGIVRKQIEGCQVEQFRCNQQGTPVSVNDPLEDLRPPHRLSRSNEESNPISRLQSRMSAMFGPLGRGSVGPKKEKPAPAPEDETIIELSFEKTPSVSSAPSPSPAHASKSRVPHILRRTGNSIPVDVQQAEVAWVDGARRMRMALEDQGQTFNPLVESTMVADPTESAKSTAKPKSVSHLKPAVESSVKERPLSNPIPKRAAVSVPPRANTSKRAPQVSSTPEFAKIQLRKIAASSLPSS